MRESVLLSIADQSVIVDGGKSMRYFDFIVGLAAFIVKNNESFDGVMEFSFDQVVDDVPFSPYLSFEVSDTKYCFGEKDGLARFSMEKTCGDRHKFLMQQVSPNRFIATEAFNPYEVRAVLLYSYSFFCHKRNLFSMHSSCVVYNGEAVLFLGKSGTGKSTHTKLWCDNFEGASLLNDDCPIVQIGEKIMVHGSPWSGKTHCYKKLCFPLKAVVKLKQAPENNMYQLDRQKAVAAIFQSFQPILTECDAFADYVFDAMSEMISNVPIYHFDCLPNVEAARISRKMIFGE